IIIAISIILFIISISAGLAYFLIHPQAVLEGEKEIIINIGDSYTEDGIKTKILDFNINPKYKINGELDNTIVGTYELVYTTDIGYLYNKDSVTRIIHVVDEDAPSIKLTDGDITLFVGDTYIEPGYTAHDAYDGDITKKVEVTNNINTSLAGSYTIEYKVEDSSNNIAIQKRNIIVKEKITTTTTSKTITTTANNNNSNNTTKKINTKSKGVAILMYHYFYDKTAGETGKNSNYMEIHDFEAQMKYLSDNKYYFPSWQEIADYVDGKITLPAKSIVVTIDDGQYTFFNLALPILNKYNITATPFIITSKAGGNKVAKYQYPNINYQSHTHAMHQGGCKGGRGGLFRCIDHDKGVADLKKSATIVGHNDAIAYPFGDVTDNVLKITKDAGFKVGVTIKYGKAKPGMDRYQLPRIRMYKGMSLSVFKNSI
ncbi:MAG: DUF5011 domain-containing protein, partial [Bacilli bacterium]|nr:DUF5011 domain-containing protein [Bacilli bacterium]